MNQAADFQCPTSVASKPACNNGSRGFELGRLESAAWINLTSAPTGAVRELTASANDDSRNHLLCIVDEKPSFSALRWRIEFTFLIKETDMQPTPQARPALRTFLTLAAALSSLISLLTLYAIMSSDLLSYSGITVFLLITIAIAVASSKKLATLDTHPATVPASASSGSTGQQLVGAYDVVYKGGLPEYPQSKMGKIRMEIWPERFNLVPTLGTKQWFSGLAIPFDTIADVQIVQRQVNTFEGLLGGLDSRQLNQANNIHITFQSADGRALVLRLEMLSGLTVMGQAAKCLEFVDRLRTGGIRDHFLPAPAPAPAPAIMGAPSIPEQIEQLAQLRDKGFITALEYDAKKAELLLRM